MSTSTETSTAVRATLNYAADRQDGGVFSNFDPSLAKQSLDPREVEIRDGRKLASPPKFDVEGFELHRLPFPNLNLLDAEWVAKVYVPQVQEYVKKVTGAAHVVSFQGLRALIRDTGKFVPGYSIAAAFVHIDQTRTSALPMMEKLCGAEIRTRYPHIRIYNAWRAQTPPPQDVPLAICDQRTLDQDDWVEAKAVEPGMDHATAYLTSMYNPAQRWHYFSNMTPDEMTVFKAWDSDPSAPIGCPHTAFRNQNVPAGTIPRVSAELRFFGFFES